MKRQGIVKTKQAPSNHYGCDPYNTVDASSMRGRIINEVWYKDVKLNTGRYNCLPCRVYEKVTSC